MDRPLYEKLLTAKVAAFKEWLDKQDPGVIIDVRLNEEDIHILLCIKDRPLYERLLAAKVAAFKEWLDEHHPGVIRDVQSNGKDIYIYLCEKKLPKEVRIAAGEMFPPIEGFTLFYH